MKTETHFKLTYTKLSGERAEKTFPTLERLTQALDRTKAENPGHDMAPEITPVEVEVWTRVEKPFVASEYREWLQLETEQQDYFRSHAPHCGRALGYDC